MAGLIAIGVGCRKSCSVEAIVALVRRALAECGRDSLLSRGGESGRGVAPSFLNDAQFPCSDGQRDPPSRPPPTRGEGEPPSRLPPTRGEGEASWGDDAPRLFSLADKRDEPGLNAAAEALGLDLVFLSREALAAVAPRLLSRSAAARRRFGLEAVAEAAALVGGGPRARLLAPRLAADGATCAIAVDCGAWRGDPR